MRHFTHSTTSSGLVIGTRYKHIHECHYFIEIQDIVSCIVLCKGTDCFGEKMVYTNEGDTRLGVSTNDICITPQMIRDLNKFYIPIKE